MRDMARSNTKLQAKNSSTFAFIKPNIIEIQRPLEYEPPQTAIRSKWPANINNFMHLARQQEGGQVYERSLDWMLTLRTQTQSDLSTREKSANSSAQPPSVYYKTISTDGKSFNIRKLSVKDVQIKGNPGEVQHLFHKRIGEAPSQGQLNFETSLRSYRPQTAMHHPRKFILKKYQDLFLIELQKFDSIPSKPDKSLLINYTEFPLPQNKTSITTLESQLKNNFIKKIIHKNLYKNHETISGFDGAHFSQQKYDDKQFFNSNANNRLHLIKQIEGGTNVGVLGSQGRYFSNIKIMGSSNEGSNYNSNQGTRYLSTILWESNLRENENHKKNRKSKSQIRIRSNQARDVSPINDLSHNLKQNKQ